MVALLYFCSLTDVSPLVDSYSFYNIVYFPIFPVSGMFIKHLKGSFVFHFDYVTWLAFWPSLLRSRREYSLYAASMQINSFPLAKITLNSHSKLSPAKIKNRCNSGMLQSYLTHFAGGCSCWCGRSCGSLSYINSRAVCTDVVVSLP